jgi:hypothetical protein
MCHFITVFLPESADLKAVAAIFERYKVGFKPIDNPFVLAQVPPGDVCILTTRSLCDCGTPLGSLSGDTAVKPDNRDIQISKLRKRGWSQTKIERWLEQKDHEEEKQEREKDVHMANATPQLDRWVEFLSDVLRSGRTPRIGLLLHWYRGTVEGERLHLVRQERLPLTHLNTDHLLRLNEDVVYNYVP